MRRNIKGLLKKLALFVLPMWFLLTSFFALLSLANESMIMIVIFAIVIGRPVLWISPLYLTIVSWLVGYKETKNILACLIINIILLAINFTFFYWTYCLTGGWY